MEQWVAEGSHEIAARALCQARELLDAYEEPPLDATFGGVDVLCGNAGIGGPAALIEDLELSAWRNTLSANLDGAFLRTWVTAEDIARSVLFLASDAAGKISGQALSVDGHTERMS